jgi:DNA modification methylase
VSVTILHGDCREVLKTLPAQSVHCCVTSPPYFGLRDYGHGDQIGLESTPAEYVEQMVAVFREVRRVLRDDGTLWLNLGDSYNGYMANQRGTGLETKRQQARKYIEPGAGLRTDTMKNKDLMGMPWRVALALQQPRYTGRIKNELDRVWLAAMLDGEGCFYVHKRPAGQHAGDGYFRKTDTYSPAFEVANTHKSIVDRCLQIAGCGSVICQEKDRRQPLWRWTVRSDEARQLAREIFPYLVGKQQQCRIVCGMPNSGERAEAAWQAMKLLHHGGGTDVDFDTPASCHSPGWYLRQDVIWSKPNPMPESVRDRCTKAHEYVFLLSKSERYYFDADAVAEQSVTPLDVQVAKRNKAPHAGQSDPGGMRETTGGFDKITKTYEQRNKRSVWTIATKPYSEAHFATMAPELAETCIKAGCPEGGTVLDPFGGAGTTGLVADQLQRSAILCELNADYIEIARRRIASDAPLFADVREAAQEVGA